MATMHDLDNFNSNLIQTSYFQGEDITNNFNNTFIAAGSKEL